MKNDSMNSGERIAVIVPAFNAERTLRRAVDSLVRQTYKNLEVWVVDDGSTDCTPLIADELMRENANVHVIHQKNSGPYMARIAALRDVKCGWFGFCDADDYCEPNMYELMYDAAISHAVPIVCCDICGRGHAGGDEVFRGREEMFKKVWFLRSASLCDKLFRNVYDFNSFRGETQSASEDLLLNLQLQTHLGKDVGICFLHNELYHYEGANSSVQFNDKKVKCFDQIIFMVKSFAHEWGMLKDMTEFDRWVGRCALRRLFAAAYQHNLSFDEKANFVKKLFEIEDVKRTHWILNMINVRILTLALILMWNMHMLLKKCGLKIGF